MAQISHADFDGWSAGMSMVSDMFNTQLKAKLDALCSDIAAHLNVFTVPGSERSVTAAAFDVGISRSVARRIGQARRGGCSE
jgi:hypothetical protein